MANKKGKKGKITNYILLRESLENSFPGATIYTLADAQSLYVIDDQEKYKEIQERDSIIQTPGGERADYYILKFARNKKNCIVISNDRFKDYKLEGDLRNRIVHFSIIGKEIIFNETLDSFIKLNKILCHI